MEGLEIKLKDKELAKLGVQAQPANDNPGKTTASKDNDPPADPATAATTACDTIGPPAKKARKQGKKMMFKGYHEEKSNYKTVVYAISRGSGSASCVNNGESRPITAQVITYTTLGVPYLNSSITFF